MFISKEALLKSLKEARQMSFPYLQIWLTGNGYGKPLFAEIRFGSRFLKTHEQTVKKSYKKNGLTYTKENWLEWQLDVSYSDTAVIALAMEEGIIQKIPYKKGFESGFNRRERERQEYVIRTALPPQQR